MNNERAQITRLASGLLALALALSLVPMTEVPIRAAPLVTPTEGEFIEIYNPGGAAVDLSNVYLTDATYAGGGTYYYNIVTGSNAGGGGFADFHARFPSGATIGPGEYQTIALNGSANFATEFAVDPTYELYEDAAAPDAVPDMREALPGSINNQGGLTNDGEVVVLYFWDGSTDLVTDLDYALWGDKAEAVDKTGVSIDGPDANADPSTYLNDTAIASQDTCAGCPRVWRFLAARRPERGQRDQDRRQRRWRQRRDFRECVQHLVRKPTHPRRSIGLCRRRIRHQ
jgi:hypothetical protein